jgi:WhiB family redox-sensing transcriptional regulator
MFEILHTPERRGADFALAAGGTAVDHSFEDGNALTDFLLRDEDAEQRWQDKALCAQTDPETFFPEKGGSTREAKQVCTACPVSAECLQYALDHEERFGIWGGLSERERRRLKRRAA